jgi:DNA-binding XRE family transcriptional regulator
MQKKLKGGPGKTNKRPKRLIERGAKTARDPQNAAVIKEFRAAAALSREKLAARLGVGVTAVYAWERGAYEPSAEIYNKLAVMGSGIEWRFTEHFLSRAGLDERTIEHMAGQIRAMPPGFVEIRCLEDESEKLQFPKSLLGNRELTRFIRVHQDDLTPVRPGDILLIDTADTALRKLDDGSFVAVSSVSTDRKSRLRLIGFLQKQNADTRGGSGFHFLLEIGGAHKVVKLPPRPATDIDIPNVPELHRRVATAFLGFSVGDTEELAHEGLTVLGRVVAWIAASGQDEKK